MIALEIAKPNKLDFDMAISGLSEMHQPQVMFSIHANGMKYGFPAKAESNGKYVVDVPDLSKHLDKGEYDCQFEVVVGDRIYVPYKDKVSHGAITTPEISINVPGNVPETPIVTPKSVIPPTKEVKPVPVSKEISKTNMFRTFDKEQEEKKIEKKVIDLTTESKAMEVNPKFELKKSAPLPPRKSTMLKKTDEVVLGSAEINIEQPVITVESVRSSQPTQKPTLTKKEIIA